VVYHNHAPWQDSQGWVAEHPVDLENSSGCSKIKQIATPFPFSENNCENELQNIMQNVKKLLDLKMLRQYFNPLRAKMMSHFFRREIS
jgi:hypothetical protein